MLNKFSNYLRHSDIDRASALLEEILLTGDTLKLEEIEESFFLKLINDLVSKKSWDQNFEKTLTRCKEVLNKNKSKIQIIEILKCKTNSPKFNGELSLLLLNSGELEKSKEHLRTYLRYLKKFKYVQLMLETLNKYSANLKLDEYLIGEYISCYAELNDLEALEVFLLKNKIKKIELGIINKSIRRAPLFYRYEKTREIYFNYLLKKNRKEYLKSLMDSFLLVENNFSDFLLIFKDYLFFHKRFTTLNKLIEIGIPLKGKKLNKWKHTSESLVKQMESLSEEKINFDKPDFAFDLFSSSIEEAGLEAVDGINREETHVFLKNKVEETSGNEKIKFDPSLSELLTELSFYTNEDTRPLKSCHIKFQLRAYQYDELIHIVTGLENMKEYQQAVDIIDVQDLSNICQNKKINLFYLRSELLIKSKRYSEAIDFCRKVLRSMPLIGDERTNFKYLCAEAYFKKGEFLNAKSIFLEIKKINKRFRLTQSRLDSIEKN